MGVPTVVPERACPFHGRSQRVHPWCRKHPLLAREESGAHHAGSVPERGDTGQLPSQGTERRDDAHHATGDRQRPAGSLAQQSRGLRGDALTEMHPDGGSRQRFETLARSVRAWALSHPSQWTLLYGTPVRGYAAPRERTVGPGTRVLARLLEIVETSPTPTLRADLGAGRGRCSARERPTWEAPPPRRP